MHGHLGTANAARRAAELTAALRQPSVDRTEVQTILARRGEPAPVTLSGADLRELVVAAEILIDVFEAESLDEAAASLNAILAGQAGPPRLTAHDGTPWHLHTDKHDDAPWGSWFLTSSSLALATVLADRQAPPGGICGADGCRNPFVNLGRGAPQRYCCARCANRTRVASHRHQTRNRRPNRAGIGEG